MKKISSIEDFELMYDQEDDCVLLHNHLFQITSWVSDMRGNKAETDALDADEILAKIKLGRLHPQLIYCIVHQLSHQREWLPSWYDQCDIGCTLLRLMGYSALSTQLKHLRTSE